MKKGYGVYGDVGVATLIVLGIAMVYISYISAQLTALYQFGLAIISMVAIGIAITRIKSLNGAFGAYMIGGRSGIKFIDRLSRRHRRFWNAMAMWGLVLGFGLLTYPLLKGRLDKRIYLFGIFSIIVFVAVLLPNMLPALQLIQLPQLQNVVSSASAAQGTPAVMGAEIIETAVSAVLGFSGYVIIAILSNAVYIGSGIAAFMLSVAQGAPQISHVTQQVPSVAPLLPGIDIPLIPGIIALAFLLVVHEFSHGVLSRVYGIKIKSIGMLLFGVIPMGAYVEPDEKKVNKLDSLKQSKIFAAGVSANFIFAVIFFIPFMLSLMYLLPLVSTPGVYINNTLNGYPAAISGVQPGSRIISWNGHNVTNITAFEDFAIASERPNATVVLGTDKGNYTLKEVQYGSNSSKWIVGISVIYKQIAPKSGFLDQLGFNLYATMAFLFMLNFLVAVVNYLPIPGFDGWRIYKANIKNGRIVTALSLIVIVGLLLGVAPLVANYL